MPTDAEVQRIIQEALNNSWTSANYGGARAHSLTERLNNALGYVIRQRNRGGHCEEAWALADHYLHARYFVANGMSESEIMVRAYGYNGLKALLDAGDSIVNVVARGLTGADANLITPRAPTRHVAFTEQRAGVCVTSRPSLMDLRWARRGARDGMADRRDLNINRQLLAPAHP
jgi:hypothetical protein